MNKKKTSSLTPYLILVTTLLLGACGGGSSGSGSSSFTVTATANANGSISPASADVIENSSANLTIVPDAGYVIDTVSGCGGTLAGNIYTTAAIMAGCTVTASFAVTTLTAVSPLFPTNGANWNDYVGGSDFTLASDTACNISTDTICLHGGETRVFEATGLTDCTDLSATDSLGAFNWACDASSGTVRFVSTGFVEDKAMSDLIDFAAPGFLDNAVTLLANNMALVSSSSDTWWTNAFLIDNDGGALDTSSTIYIATASASTNYTLGSDKVSLVVQPGVVLDAGGVGSSAITVGFASHTWFEGSIDATDDFYGIALFSARFSTLRKVTVINADNHGIYASDIVSNRFINVKTSNNGNEGISLNGAMAKHNRIIGLIASQNTVTGLVSSGASNNTFSNITAINNGVRGVNIGASSINNILANITTNNNSTTEAGLLLNNGSSNNLLNAITGNMNEAGLHISTNSHYTTVMSSAFSNNDGPGFAISGADNNTFSDIASANNRSFGMNSSGSDNNRYTGLFEVGNNVTDCFVNASTDPGLVHDTCLPQGASDFTAPITGIDLTNAFVGKVLTDDAVNTDDTNGSAAAFPAAPNTFDWTGFENQFRGWGLDGSLFPNADHQGQWTTGAGRIWDWSIALGDNGNAGNAALLNVLAIPSGNDTLSHDWKGTPATDDDAGCDAIAADSKYIAGSAGDIRCRTTFLRRAVEIMGDARGNENTLCETDEICLHTANIGSYQGHGDLLTSSGFVDGTLTGITLKQYSINGR